MDLKAIKPPQDIYEVVSLVAILTLFYLISQNRRTRQRFLFNFTASEGRLSSDNIYEVSTDGTIRNTSLNENTLVNIYLVVWENYKHNSYLRFGLANDRIFDLNDNKQIKPPLYFFKREAKRVRVHSTFSSKGTSDEKILSQHIQIGSLYLPKYRYELVFEDIDGNYFDQQGYLINIKEASLWWSLESTFAKLKTWDIRPYLAHSIKILLSKFTFFFRRLLWNVGF